MEKTTAQTEESKIIVAGFGGQGVLTLGKLLCLASLQEGNHVTYVPSYGTEVRGGTANCRVIVGEEPIGNPIIEQADSLIILNQLSFERFSPRLKPDGLFLVNSSLAETAQYRKPPHTALVKVPATEKAAELGETLVANVVMLGAFAEVSGLAGEKALRAALERSFKGSKRRLLELNVKALGAGAELAGASLRT